MFMAVTVTHRGTLCWWGDLLEERATKEKQSVHTWMEQQKNTFIKKIALKLLTSFHSLKMSLLLDFRGTEDLKVSRGKREPRVKRGHQGSR